MVKNNYIISEKPLKQFCLFPISPIYCEKAIAKNSISSFSVFLLQIDLSLWEVCEE